MKENDLIEQLVRNHQKVTPVEPIRSRFFKWLIISVICLSVGISTLGLREDWQILFTNPLLLIQNVFIFLSVIMTGFFSIKLSQPGEVFKTKTKPLIIIITNLWLLILLAIGLVNDFNMQEFSKIKLGCVKDILILGIIPGAILFILMLKGVILKNKIAGLFAFITAFSLGAWGVQYTCHNDDPIHILLWHFIPVLLLGMIGITFGNKFIKKV